MSDSPVITSVANTIQAPLKLADAAVSGNNIIDPLRRASLGLNPITALPFLVSDSMNVAQDTKNKAEKSASDSVAAANAFNVQQDNIRSLGKNLAGKGSQEISGIDFSSLTDGNLASNLNARRDSILTRRQAPGRAQTILASKIR